MNIKKIVIVVVLVFFCANAFSQIGIRAGLNMTNQIRSFSREDIANSFNSENFNAFQVGLVWQIPFGKSGLGTEIGAIYTQKGSFYTYADGSVTFSKFDEMNYLEVPLNIRYKLMLGSGLGVYAYAGLYAAYMLQGRTINELTNEVNYMWNERNIDNLDYGYSYGFGLELLRKIQLGVTWNNGLKSNSISTVDVVTGSKNKSFSVNLVYLF